MSARDRQVGGDHYRGRGIQPWDAMADWMSQERFVGFLKGNVLKYVARSEHKGTELEDLRKASHYLEKLIEVLEADGGGAERDHFSEVTAWLEERREALKRGRETVAAWRKSPGGERQGRHGPDPAPHEVDEEGLRAFQARVTALPGWPPAPE